MSVINIVDVEASGNNQASATAISRASGLTIVKAYTTGNPSTERAVKLPSDALIGDIFEIYADNSLTQGAKVCVPSGEYLDGAQNADVQASYLGGFVSFRKVASGEWRSS